MRNYQKFYIDGQWVTPEGAIELDVINPCTEERAGVIALGNEAHVNQAVAAARAAFPAWSRTTREERVEVLQRICSIYERRLQEMAEAITDEMGAPLTNVSLTMQAPAGLGHFMTTTEILQNFEFEKTMGTTTVVHEPAGVCALITPWNWPINQIACKVAPALAAGCTMVLKPSEVAPFSAYLMAEIIDEAGVPPGVFNLVNGDGPGVGSPLTAHPDIDFVSFTGSTRAGTMISKAAADTVKGVALELGGKSANIILDDADLEQAVTHGVSTMMLNSGQSCNAPSRMLVPASRLEEAEAIAGAICGQIVVGDTRDEATTMGPLASKVHFDKVQGLIKTGIEEGAKLVCGGPGLPDSVQRGYFTQPTVFSAVNNQMTIAREEIFGPVLCMIPYETEEDAVDIANDTLFGLSGYVFGGDKERVRAVARRLRTGNVHLNGAGPDFQAPFGGYRQSGVGREWGIYGFEEFLEVKAILGDREAEA
ncbi:aldehyde dehydrogenase family protein [Seongchinamella sediminis]|uniref:Aldehyde dehydrogenase family protein n=1 Tax=Seongchinamella sediminis TaxID=2283635 RepID=A0A3L7E0C8_9GAMM|nr:aldehyde dehydrogenase family protein [Seongchinamella sediminis]RLQ22379.1 aldehyde dehydrogenase family protein [Seongchinamella sediminis]